MKTAISVDDVLMAEADRTASELGMSRSGLISAALKEFLESRRRNAITDALNRIYAQEPRSDERQTVRQMKSKFPIGDKW